MNRGDVYALSNEAFEQMVGANTAGLEKVDLEHEKLARSTAFSGRAVSQPMDGTFSGNRIGSTAILPITGMIRPRPSFSFFDIFGGSATSLTLASRDLEKMMADDSITRIVLAIDSPGGLVSGVNEFANQVFEARSGKEIVAFVDHACASAAFWIGAAASEVVISETGMAGSIGTQMSFTDTTEAMANAGLKEVVITSSQSPNKNQPLNTAEGVEAARSVLDAQAQIFIDSVARFRGVSSETVEKDFGQGSLFVGQNAVAAGLADKTGSFNELLEINQTETTGAIRMDRNEQLAALVKNASAGTIFGVNAFGDLVEMDLTSEATLKEVAPQAIAAIKQAAFDDGLTNGVAAHVEAETKRVEEIDTVFAENKLFKPVADEMKSDPKATAATIMLECNARMIAGTLTEAGATDNADTLESLAIEGEQHQGGTGDDLEATLRNGVAADDESLAGNVVDLPNKAIAAGIASAAKAINAQSGE